MKNKKTYHMIIKAGVAVLAVLCLVLAFLIVNGQRKAKAQEAADTEEQSQAIDNTIEWKGKEYVYNNNLTNILFLGIDQTDPIADAHEAGLSGQSDCLMLLSLDKEAKQGRILQINRNTMTELDVYDASGGLLMNETGQLTLQYAYANGGESSCWAVKKTLSELLYGLPIDGYLAINLGGIGLINDAIGGVDVTMKEDYTMIDPSFVQGSTVHLAGDLTEKFVRYRDITIFNSVEGRMHRQVDYVVALIAKMKSTGGRKMYDILSPFLDDYIITDMDADSMEAFADYDYLTDEVQYLPGEEVMGEPTEEGKVYEEYHIDEEALQDMLIHTYYKEVGQQ